MCVCMVVVLQSFSYKNSAYLFPFMSCIFINTLSLSYVTMIMMTSCLHVAMAGWNDRVRVIAISCLKPKTEAGHF